MMEVLPDTMVVIILQYVSVKSTLCNKLTQCYVSIISQ